MVKTNARKRGRKKPKIMEEILIPPPHDLQPQPESDHQGAGFELRVNLTTGEVGCAGRDGKLVRKTTLALVRKIQEHRFYDFRMYR